MENFIAAFQVILPLIILIGVGYYLNYRRVVKQETWKELNKLVFKVFLPVLLFRNMLEMDIANEMNIYIILYAIMTILLLFVFLCIVVKKIIPTKSRAVTVIQGIYRSNFALFGIAVTESMYGTGNAGVTGILVAVIVPLFNVLAVILFTSISDERMSIKNILKGIAKNPLIIGTLAGVLFKITKIELMSGVESGITMLSNLATPTALLVLGGTFSIPKTIKNWMELLAVIIGRLLVVPVIFVVLSVLLGYRDKELFALFIMYASPTAVASFSMAESMGGDGELAGQIVVFTTVISLVTCTIGIFIMKVLNLV